MFCELNGLKNSESSQTTSISWASLSQKAQHSLEFVLEYHSVLNHYCFDNFWQVEQLLEQKISKKAAQHTIFTAFYGLLWDNTT